MDTLALLRAASTATLTSVLREHGLRNTFMHGVAPLRPDCRVAGPAFTLRYLPAHRVLDGASIVGTYPPIEDTLRAYRESRS